MIIVTGGAGFIGSNLIRGLNKLKYTDILVVDDLKDGTKFKNIVDCDILDYKDKAVFLDKISKEEPLGEKIEAIFHFGACTDSTEWDGTFMMNNNYEYSKTIFKYCLSEYIPFIYASSAATYGINPLSKEQLENELPINIYGYSKWLFDQYVRRYLPKPKSQVVGLRFFNVYGPREQHKGAMSSVILRFNQQLLKDGVIKLFAGRDGYADGEQQRDFIYVDDVVDVNLWFWRHPELSGIFNVGTGTPQSFNAVAQAVIEWHGFGKIEYIPFPEHLCGHYQSFTKADLTNIRKIGYSGAFKTIQEGVALYLNQLQNVPLK